MLPKSISIFLREEMGDVPCKKSIRIYDIQILYLILVDSVSKPASLFDDVFAVSFAPQDCLMRRSVGGFFFDLDLIRRVKQVQSQLVRCGYLIWSVSG
jgi:hypothetical protein